MKPVSVSVGNSFPPPESVATPRRTPVVDRTQADPEVVKAAEGMESMFIEYMMKVMRDTIPKNDLDLENPATQIYRGMLDGETSQQAARAGGVGLADQIIAHLQGAGYTGSRAPAQGLGVYQQAAKKTTGNKGELP